MNGNINQTRLVYGTDTSWETQNAHEPQMQKKKKTKDLEQISKPPQFADSSTEHCVLVHPRHVAARQRGAHLGRAPRARRLAEHGHGRRRRLDATTGDPNQTGRHRTTRMTKEGNE